MQMNPYLSFNGQCEAAFKLYEQCLGGQLATDLPLRRDAVVGPGAGRLARQGDARQPHHRRSGIDGRRRRSGELRGTQRIRRSRSR